MATSKYSPAQTIIFDEEGNKFEGFFSLFTEMMCTIGTVLIAFKGGILYTHDNEPNCNNFFGVQYPSNITPLFNKDVLIKKKFLSLGYQSSDNKKWACPSISTNTINPQTGIIQESLLIEGDFDLEETILTAAFLMDKNSMADAQLALVEGDFLGGNYIKVKMELSAANSANLVSLSHPYVISEVSQRNF